MTITIIDDDLWFCEDCTQAAVNDDYSGLDYYLSEKAAARRMKEIQEALAYLGRQGNVVPNFDEDEGEDEFSTRDCDCCGTGLAGWRMRFSLLGEDNETNLPR
jgi:hypothetical protein